ncbi:MAG: hypothetical protein GOV01_03805 [Candidatus Altiarchaeota archaeon]|nr:hypothetical protein [Candidatus Altiarchaeota archaeon]
MSGPKGFVAQLATLALAGIVGIGVAWWVSEQAKLKITTELYLSDLSSINMLYQSRNIQEYIRLSQDDIIREFVNSGGPVECGRVPISNRMVSVWKAGTCEIEYWSDYAVDLSGEIAFDIVSMYAGGWGVAASYNESKFCLNRADKLPFGFYRADVCFESGLVGVIDTAFRDMIDSYEAGGATCACFDTYTVCWKDLNSYNFTYGLIESC